MKTSINLVPPEPENKAEKERERKVILASEIILVVFIIFNLAIFGFYWFLVKSTTETRSAIKKEEERIASRLPTEKLYRSLLAKISFLNPLWQKKIKPEEVLDFSQSLLISQLKLKQLLLDSGGLTSLSLQAENTDILESFLKIVMDKEKTKQIKDIVVKSTEKNEKGGYNFVISFKYLGNQ